MRNSLSIAFKVTKYFSIRPFPVPPYDLKHLSPQILLKIVSTDEQKRNSPQILLKIVTTDEQKRNSPQILLKIVSGVCCSFGQLKVS